MDQNLMTIFSGILTLAGSIVTYFISQAAKKHSNIKDMDALAKVANQAVSWAQKNFNENPEKLSEAINYVTEEAKKLKIKTNPAQIEAQIEASLAQLKKNFTADPAKTIKDVDDDTIVVAAGYADAHRVGAVDPMEIPKVAKDAGCDLAMLDTAVKDGHTLFDYLSIEDLEKFVNEAHSYGLKTALAGSVKKEQLKPLNDIGCDVVGIRGAACVGGDRNTGKIHHTAVAELKELCDSF